MWSDVADFLDNGVAGPLRMLLPGAKRAKCFFQNFVVDVTGRIGDAGDVVQQGTPCVGHKVVAIFDGGPGELASDIVGGAMVGFAHVVEGLLSFGYFLNRNVRLGCGTIVKILTTPGKDSARATRAS